MLCYRRTCIKRSPMGNGDRFIQIERLTQFHRLGVFKKKQFKTPLSAKIDHLIYRISLRNTTFFDFGKGTWIQHYVKYYS